MADIPALNTQQWQIYKQQNSAVNIKNNIESLKKNRDADLSEQDQLKKACQDFESLFVAQMLKDMRNAIPKEELFHGGNAEEIYTSMLDENYAKEISKNGSLGLGKQLYETLSKNLAASKNTSAKGD